MAGTNNTNPQAINFCNQKVRPTVDAIMSAVLSAQTLIAEWNAQNIVAIIPNDSNPIQDGSTVASGTTDGRPPITDGQVNVVISNMTTFVNLFTANTNLIFNQFAQMMVNAKSVI